MKTFNRFRGAFPSLTEEQLAVHDDSKFSVLEVLGYTDRWILGNESSTLWNKALEHHYSNNPHHPQFHLREGSDQANMPLKCNFF